MLRRWVLLASFCQALVNSIWGQWNNFTVCQQWLLTTYLRLATILGWLQRNIWFTGLLSYPGLYFNACKLCTCWQPISFKLAHRRWQPYAQGGWVEMARVWQDEGRYRENGHFGRVASGVSHKCRRCNKVPTLGLGPKRDQSSQYSPIKSPNFASMSPIPWIIRLDMCFPATVMYTLRKLVMLNSNKWENQLCEPLICLSW